MWWQDGRHFVSKDLVKNCVAKQESGKGHSLLEVGASRG